MLINSGREEVRGLQSHALHDFFLTGSSDIIFLMSDSDEEYYLLSIDNKLLYVCECAVLQCKVNLNGLSVCVYLCLHFHKISLDDLP